MMSRSICSSSTTICCKKRLVLLADVVLTKALLLLVLTIVVVCFFSSSCTITNNSNLTTTTTTRRARTSQKACYTGISGVVNAFTTTTTTTTITTPIQRRVYYNINNHSHRQQSTMISISNNNNSNNNIFSLTKPSLLLSHHHHQQHNTKLFLFKRLRNKLTSNSDSDDSSSSTSSRSDSKNDSVVTSSSSSTAVVVEDKLSSSKSNNNNNNNNDNDNDDDSKVTEKEEEARTKTLTTTTAVIERPSSSSSTNEAVDKLRKEASKIRMEAERMEILLTLEKIDTLEKKIKVATFKGNEEDIQKVEEQINTLKRKLNTSEEKATSTTRPKVKTDSYQIASFSKDDVNGNDNDNTSSSSSSNNNNVDDNNNDTSSSIELLTKEEINKRIEQFESVPKFLQLLVAKAAGFDKDLSNTTAIILKMHQDEVEMESLIGESETTSSKGGKQKIMIKGKKNNSETSKGLVGLMNDLQKESEEQEEETDEDRIETMLESLYPKSLKEYNGNNDEIVSNPMPTEQDIKDFINIINQPKIFIAQTKPPERTSMGYIVRGVNKLNNGTSLIEHIDDMVGDKFDNILRYWYINDPTPVTEEQVLSGERDPILLVSGYNSIGSTSPYEKFQWKIGRSIITSMGIFTTIFYTVFPFFFNDKVANRVDEILSLAGSQQITPSQLNWFTELQSPLLLSMLFVILSHELGHWLVSLTSESKFQISLPTLAPSPIFGLMSSITRLKTSPKNRIELMDFALCGPWFGIIVSSFLLSYGLDLTVTAPPDVAEYFPALPISFIQASSLISSIVDQTLHNGILNSNGIDPSTPIYLHPYAIAGYAGLMINALNLTPFGRTDGGRIALCMFGRTGAQILSLITLVVLLFAGLIGNDSFLTYFLFASFFQGELDIPLQDETDELDVIRIGLGLVTSAFVLLTLIPV